MACLSTIFQIHARLWLAVGIENNPIWNTESWIDFSMIEIIIVISFPEESYTESYTEDKKDFLDRGFGGKVGKGGQKNK